MKPIAKVVLALLAAAFVAVAFGVLFPSPARAQAVTDAPIMALPATLEGAALDVDIANQRACAAWWVRDADRYGDWHVASAFCSGAACTAALDALGKPGALATLTAMRTVNITAADVRPCIDKLPVPPAAWIVAPISTGKRPAYLLKADGTRGAQSGYADTTLSGNGNTVPMWCNCRVRSVETTSSTYCTWATARQISDPSEPVRVALCRAQ